MFASQKHNNLMKKNSYKYLTIFFYTILISSCKNQEQLAKHTQYSLTIKATSKINAPALQSFVHAVSGNEWLLFAGRTNSKDSLNGGLHKLNGNYANTSFTKTSFNDSLFVYNPYLDLKSVSIHYDTLIQRITSQCFNEIGQLTIPCYQQKELLNNYRSLFNNTNALVRQEGDYLYVVGGYGHSIDSPESNYNTFNQIAKINVPNLIKIIKGEKLLINEIKEIIRIGENTNLISTGGELFKIDETFYLVGGHNFGNNVSKGQKYLDAVYLFTIEDAEQPFKLNINVSSFISDVQTPTNSSSDSLSIFRRRDGPILPSIYRNPTSDTSNTFEQGIGIYTGVFKPGKTLRAWNDAIYLHPKWKNNDKLYTYDSLYNQNNFNVYAAPNFVAFDSDTSLLHSYIIGGIGDGNSSPKNHLSGFTNSAVHIKTFLDTLAIKSTYEVLDYNIFEGTNSNQAPFYGAEAILFPNKQIKYSTYSSEIIDLKKSFVESDSIEVGYIYGGIEAYEANPHTYGANKSSASNKIWTVTLRKNL